MSIGSLIAMLGGLLLLVLGKVCLDLASKQIHGWLFDLCFVVLRVARRRLTAALRVAWHDEELVPELKWLLFDRYANEPVVGLFKGFRFALGHVRGAKRLTRESGVERRGEAVRATELLPAEKPQISNSTTVAELIAAAPVAGWTVARTTGISHATLTKPIREERPGFVLGEVITVTVPTDDPLSPVPMHVLRTLAGVGFDVPSGP